MGSKQGRKKKAPAKKRRSIAEPRTRLAGALRRLEDALARDPQDLGARVRSFHARFHDYSPMNRTLIFLQRPDATFVMGREQWRSRHGREVKKEAGAIFILAPELGRGDPSTAITFTHVKVYDVSDTNGEPFAPPAPPPARASEELVAERLRELEAWVRGSGLKLRYEARSVNALIDGATNGLTIWVRPDLGPADRLAVLAHEIAHVKLHFRKNKRGHMEIADASGQRPSRDLAELEAELMSFLLLAFSGIDSSEGSAAYLNCWKASMTSIRERAERCFVVACSVLRECERRSYRRLVDEDTVVILEEARTALE
jgi:hypothetical protein